MKISRRPDFEATGKARRSLVLLLVLIPSAAPAAVEPDQEQGAATMREGSAVFDIRVAGLLIGSVERNRPAQPYDLDPVTTLGGAGPTLEGVEGYLSPTEDDEAVYALLAADLEVRPAAALRLQLGADTGLLRVRDGELQADGRPLGEEVEATWLLRTAWAELVEPSQGAFGLGAGRRAVRIAEGLLFDEYATGFELFGGLGAWNLTVAAWIPGREVPPDGEPFFTGELSWLFGFMSRVSLFAAVQRPDDVTARALVDAAFYDARVEREPGTGNLVEARRLYCSQVDGETEPWWLGGSFELVLEGQTLRGAAVAGFGTATFDARIDRTRGGCRDPRLQDRHVEVDLRSHAVDVTWRARAAETVWLGAFGMLQSGGTLDADTTTYTSFLAIAPYFERPAVFFDAGLAAAYEPRVHPPAGVAGRGVLALGPTLLFAPTADLEISGLVATLFAREDGPGGGDRHYGEEVDARVTWRALEAFTLLAEGGAWWLGGFFPEDGTVWQARAGLRAEWPP